MRRFPISLRDALLLAMVAGALQLAVSLFFFASSAVRSPAAWQSFLQASGLFLLIKAYFAPMTMLLFLWAFYSEIRGFGSVRGRQVAAWAAMAGLTVAVWDALAAKWRLSALLSEGPLSAAAAHIDMTQQWMITIVTVVAPDFAWLLLLAFFARKSQPLEERLARVVAAALCVIEAAWALWHTYKLAIGTIDAFPFTRPADAGWALAMQPAAVLASASLSLLMYIVWRSTRSPQALRIHEESAIVGTSVYTTVRHNPFLGGPT